MTLYEIIENLYLAGFSDLLSLESEEALNLFVINCTKDLGLTETEGGKPFKLPNLRVAVDDNGTRETLKLMVGYMKEIPPIIDERLKNKQKVVVHCQAGQQRSAGLICAYLVYKGMDLYEAIRLIMSKKSDAFDFKVNFMESLITYATEIAGKPHHSINIDENEELYDLRRSLRGKSVANAQEQYSKYLADCAANNIADFGSTFSEPTDTCVDIVKINDDYVPIDNEVYPRSHIDFTKKILKLHVYCESTLPMCEVYRGILANPQDYEVYFC